MSKDAVEFNRLNIEALVEAGRISAKGTQELAKTNIGYVRTNLEEATKVFQASMKVATPKEFFEKQTDYLRATLDRVMDQASQNTDAVVKLAGEAYKPVADRLNSISSELKKAA
jgi:phasin family protein